MAKSPTEMIRELQSEVARLTQRLDSFQDEVRRADLLAVRERLVVIESQLAELRKREEENDRRRWQMSVVFFTSILTLVIQIVVAVIKK